MHLSPNQLLAHQIDALFVSDEQGRLRLIREPGYAENELELAPRFFMGRTVAGNHWRFRSDLPRDLVQELEVICCSEPISANLREPAHTNAAIRALLNDHAAISYEERGPAYWIPDQGYRPPNIVLITAANAHLLQSNFPGRIAATADVRRGPLVATVVNDAAVAICYCARITTHAAEAGVETVETWRRHGHASAAVAGWASAVRSTQRVPLYSTWWANLASQGVARKLGMIQYAEDWSIS
jgi:RimJ/RimL family protein N-acetyltransferase